MIRFTVLGTPIQQGSARAFVRNGRAVITSDTRRDLKAWRRRIAVEARRASGGATIPGNIPVTVRLVFRMPAPKTMPKGRIAPTTTPDLDKLLRASFDALALGGVFSNDSQVVDAHAVKLYATPAKPAGVYIEVEFGPDWGGDDLRRLRCGNCGHSQEPLTAVITVGDREMPGVPS